MNSCTELLRFSLSRAFLSPVVALLVCIAPACGATVADRYDFGWREANSRMSTAETIDDFAAAADVYRELADEGLRNGPLFYNLGTALLLSEQYAAAEQALYRAERYMGSSEDVRRNLELSITRGERSKAGNLPWYRAFLFWHYGLPGSLRVGIALSAFSAIWIGFALRVAGAQVWSRHLIAFSIVVFVLFGSSVASTLYEESRSGTALPPGGDELTLSVPKQGVGL